MKMLANLKKSMLFLILFVFSGLTCAQDFHVAIARWDPFIMITKGKATGISIDYVRELCRRLGVNLVLHELPWLRAIRMFERGEVDAMVNLYFTQARTSTMTFAIPYYENMNMRFYTYKKSGVRIKQHADLYQYEIGAVEYAANYPNFDLDAKIKTHATASDEHALKMLLHHRFKLIIAAEIQMDHMLDNSDNSEQIEKLDYAPSQTSAVHIALSKKSAFIKELPRINQYTRAILEEGLIESYAKKHIRKHTKAHK
ncbi:family 3 extracellular solute-binding protein [Psychromonas sp. CNPT3]|nr:family 3 extracellular solute-binding protein [Psychromonas sp. CNPT3]